MLTKRAYIRLFILVVGGVTVGWLVFSKVSASAKEKGDGERPGDQPTLVTTHTVEPMTIYDTLAVVGTLKADESITVRNETPGKVVSLDFEEGERVEKGQPLVQMRHDTLRAELEVQQRRRDLLETQVERQRQVLDEGGVSQHEFDTTANELHIARAEVDRIRAQIDEAVVRAPFDGVIGIRDISPGAILAGGADIARLRKTDVLDLEFTVPERFADRIEKGQRAHFRVHGSDRLHDAEITTIEPGLEPGNRALRVQARVDNEDGEFRPGAFARIQVVLEELEDVLTVPPAAVVKSAEGSSVWINDDGEAARRQLTTGFRNAERVEVTEGLSAGDEVVVTGRDNLEVGAALEVDDSKTAMDVDSIEPDPATSGMRNQLFSDRELEEALREEASAPAPADDSQPDNSQSDDSQPDDFQPDDEEAQ